MPDKKENNAEEKKALKKLSMTNDFVFKRIFAKRGNEEFLREFLSNLLNIDIKEIEVAQDVMLSKKVKDDKYGVLDIKAKLNDNIEVDIEMQVLDYDNIIERTTYYASKMVSSQLKPKEEYKDIRPVIVVAILNFDLFEFEEYITKAVTVAEKHREKIINDLVTYYYIELPKFRNRKVDLDNKVNQWLTFIDSKDEKGIVEAMEKNEKLKKANEELEVLSSDEEVRELAEFRESSLREMASAIRYGKDKGKTEGRAEGRAEGRNERNIEIAKLMLKENASIDFISRVTGLAIEEIEKLK